MQYSQPQDYSYPRYPDLPSNHMLKGRGGFSYGRHKNNGHRRNFKPYQTNVQSNPRQFWCETCDRDFKSNFLLEEHKQQHQTCNIDGCKFVAHPKVITKHIQMQHSSGLYNKIAKLDNPEEIQKWRDERKKRFPTKENIARKLAQTQEKIQRGERIGLHTKKPCQNAQTSKSNNLQNSRNPNNTPKFQQTKKRNRKPQDKKTKLIPEINQINKLQPFRGIQGLLMESDDDTEIIGSVCLIEDEECSAETDIHIGGLQLTNPAVCGALSSLIHEYGSTDEETFLDTCQKPNDDKKTPIQVNSDVKAVDNTEPFIIDKADSDSGPEEVEVTKQTIIPQQPEILPKIKIDKPVLKRQNKSLNVKNKRVKPKPPSTLLTKLLSSEIRQERNMVLQCIRYIVENNYFDKKL